MALSYVHVDHVDSASNNTTVITSDTFDIDQYDVLIVTVGAESYQDDTTVTVSTNGVAWGFTDRADSWTYNSGSTVEHAYAGVFGLMAATTETGISVTVTTAGSPAGWKRPHMDVWKVVGADQSDWSIRTAAYGPTVGGPLYLSWTSTDDPAGSGLSTLCAIACADAYRRGTPFMFGDGITPGNGYTSTPPPGISGVNTIAEWTAPHGTKTAQVEEPSGYGLWATAIIEIRAAATVPTVNAGADATLERTTTFERTATESDNGNTITAREWVVDSGPAEVGNTIGTAAALSWTPMTAGSYVLSYVATNGIGDSSPDTVAVEVTALLPIVDAGADEVIALTDTVTRTAQETAGDSAISSRLWEIYTSPDGSEDGDDLDTDATLSAWEPTQLGEYVIRYRATTSDGDSEWDYATINVGVAGVELNILNADGDPVVLGAAIAFAGDLTDPDGSSWLFTEVTEDIRVKEGVYIRHGRADEASASQPAQCRFTLDNRTGKYSLGGRSPYWPNIRQGTPVQITIDGGEGYVTVFTGYADGFTPSYSINPLASATAQGDATVKVVASGVLRRMSQGAPVVISPVKRGIMQADGIRAYWPCEDLPNAQFIASAFPDHPGMDFSGRIHDGGNPNMPAKTPRFATSTVFDCSDPLMTINDSECYGTVPAYTDTTIWEAWCLIDFPEAGTNDETVILGVITTGDPSFWEMRYKSAGNGTITLRAWEKFQSIVLDVDGITENLDGLEGVNGRRGMLGFRVETNGADVDYEIGFLEVGKATSVGVAGQVLTSSVGRPVRVQTTTDGGHVDVTMGHIFIRDEETPPEEQIDWINAYNNEIVGERLLRMATENLLPYDQPDGDVHFIAVTDRMGPQRRGTPLEIFRDCEVCDQGILWDGITPGITYTTKRYRESRDAAMTLDASAGQLAFPFSPMHDDASRCNRMQATRTGGASSIYEDTDGALGSNIIGRYDDSMTVNVHADSSAFYYAGWAVHQGTVEGYRWPQLSLNLRANPSLILDWLAVRPGDRIDVTNMYDVNASAPEEPILLSVEGFEQTITDSTWDVNINCSLQYRWAVACAAATTGDTQDFCGRGDTDDSEVDANITVGQTSLDVAVNSGPLWTTTADDFPMYLDVGDVRVRATACTGSSSPQTFTIDPMPAARPAGTPVKLWRVPVLGL